jgi:hypothetical protein
MAWAAVATAGASLVSGMIGSDANATAGQQSGQATAASNAMLGQQAQANTTAYAPFVGTGTAANSTLANYLGISGGNGSGSAYNPISSANLVSTDANGNFVPNAQLYSSDPAFKSAFDSAMASHFAKYNTDPNLSKGSSLSGFNSDVTGRYSNGLDTYNAAQQAKSQAQSQAQSQTQANDPNFGSLLKNFSSADMANDPVYNSGLQFGLDQGTQAINRNASAAGGIDSGATLKALTRYANDYGTTKAQGSYDRFNANKNSIYNMLSGQQGVGLNATNSNQSNNTALMTGQAANTMNNGQAQAGYTIGGASAINNAVQGGIGNYLYGNRINNGSVVGANTGYGGSGTGFGGGVNGNGTGIQLNQSQMPSNWYQGK